MTVSSHGAFIHWSLAVLKQTCSVYFSYTQVIQYYGLRLLAYKLMWAPDVFIM